MKKSIFFLAIFMCTIGLADLNAQTYVRYAVPEDFATKTVYADSVLTSIVLPRGVSKLSNYPKFNAAAYELSQVLQDPDKKLLQVWVCGSASPDGLWEYNVNLSKKRTDEATAYLKNIMHIPDSLLHTESLNEDWDRVVELVRKSDIKHADKIIDIIKTKTWGERKTALQELDGGKAWKTLCKEIFPLLRCVRFAIYCQWDPSKPHLSAPDPNLSACQPEFSAPEPIVLRDTIVVKETVTVVDTMVVKETIHLRDTVFVRDTVVMVKDVAPAVAPVSIPVETPLVRKAEPDKFWLRPNIMAIKTNLVSDAMAIPSLGLEVQIYKGLSLDVSGAYGFYNLLNKTQREMSAWNVSPELRWWFGEHPLQKGSFIGIHANVSNYSFEWRDGVAYQNIPGHEAWSAGFTYGACARMGKRSHWGLEFVVGIGYGRYYQNIGNVGIDGQFTHSENVGPQLKEHFGLTKLAVNLVYRFSVAGKK